LIKFGTSIYEINTDYVMLMMFVKIVHLIFYVTGFFKNDNLEKKDFL